jgi:hypothetical protein
VAEADPLPERFSSKEKKGVQYSGQYNKNLPCMLTIAYITLQNIIFGPKVGCSHPVACTIFGVTSYQTDHSKIHTPCHVNNVHR